MNEEKIPKWVNTFRIFQTYEAFYIELGLNLPAKRLSIIKFFIHPKSAKGLAKALNEMIEGYEKEHGKLPETELKPIKKEKAVEKRKEKYVA